VSVDQQHPLYSSVKWFAHRIVYHSDDRSNDDADAAHRGVCGGAALRQFSTIHQSTVTLRRSNSALATSLRLTVLNRGKNGGILRCTFCTAPNRSVIAASDRSAFPRPHSQYDLARAAGTALEGCLICGLPVGQVR